MVNKKDSQCDIDIYKNITTKCSIHEIDKYRKPLLKMGQLEY